MSERCPNCWKEYNEGTKANFCVCCGSPMSQEIADGFERIRAVLLQTYNYQTVTHGGYVIALIIGALTIVSRWKDFEGNLWPFFLILALIFGFGVYAFSRAVFWAYLSSETSVVRINDLAYDPRKRDEYDPAITLIGRLQTEVLARFRTWSSWPLKDFVSDKATWWKRLLLIVFPLVVVILVWVETDMMRLLF